MKKLVLITYYIYKFIFYYLCIIFLKSVGFTKKFDNVWMYSQKAIDLLGEYIQRFPELIKVLLRADNTKDTFKSEEMFPDPSTRYFCF